MSLNPKTLREVRELCEEVAAFAREAELKAKTQRAAERRCVVGVVARQADRPAATSQPRPDPGAGGAATVNAREPDDLDSFIAERMQDPEFAAAFERAQRRAARRRRRLWAWGVSILRGWVA